jgi:hypothetical protein
MMRLDRKGRKARREPLNIPWPGDPKFETGSGGFWTVLCLGPAEVWLPFALSAPSAVKCLGKRQ